MRVFKYLKSRFISASVFMLRAFLGLGRYLPMWMLLALGRFVGWMAYLLCRGERKVGYLQLKHVVSKNSDFSKGGGIDSDSNISRVLRGCFVHVGVLVAEGLMWRRYTMGPVGKGSVVAAYGDITAQAEGDILDNIRKNNESVVGLSAHFGSFELLAAYLSGRGLDCTVLGRSPNYKVLENLAYEHRSSYGAEILWVDRPNVGRALLKAIKSKRVICALIDQDTKLKSGFAPFFGLDAACPVALIELAVKFKLRVFSCFLVRTEPFCFDTHIAEIPYDSEDENACVKVLYAYNKTLEKLVTEYPEQYIWWHRRWRRRPDEDYAKQPELLRNSAEYNLWLEGVGKTPSDAVPFEAGPTYVR